jgi:hypothetical protein
VEEPPEAESCVEYSVPTVPRGRERDVIVIVDAVDAVEPTRIVSGVRMFVCALLASVVLKVKVYVPADVGVPAILFVDGSNERPAGRLPEEIDD